MDEIRLYDDAAHRAEVIALWQQTLGYDSPHNAPGVSIDRKRAVDDGLFFVAVLGGQVAGTAMAGYDGHRGWLYSIAVHPAHSGRGLGSRLVRHAEAALAARGCLKINLQLVADNAATVAFYESLGWQVEPRISMGKRMLGTPPGAPTGGA